MAPNSIRKDATRMRGTRILRWRVKASSRTGTTSPLLPNSLTLRSVALKPKVGTQIVPSVALAVPFCDTGMAVLFAAKSIAQTATDR